MYKNILLTAEITIEQEDSVKMFEWNQTTTLWHPYLHVKNYIKWLCLH